MNPISGLILAVALAGPLAGIAQESSQAAAESESALFARVVQFAALQPDTAEFDEAWADYVRLTHGPDMDLDAAIDRVLKGANEFRRGARTPRASNTGPAMSSFKLTDKMRAIAESVIDAEQGAEN